MTPVHINICYINRWPGCFGTAFVFPFVPFVPFATPCSLSLSFYTPGKTIFINHHYIRYRFRHSHFGCIATVEDGNRENDGRSILATLEGLAQLSGGAATYPNACGKNGPIWSNCRCVWFLLYCTTHTTYNVPLTYNFGHARECHNNRRSPPRYYMCVLTSYMTFILFVIRQIDAEALVNTYLYGLVTYQFIVYRNTSKSGLYLITRVFHLRTTRISIFVGLW